MPFSGTYIGDGYGAKRREKMAVGIFWRKMGKGLDGKIEPPGWRVKGQKGTGDLFHRGD
jgi:hypothetical protein